MSWFKVDDSFTDHPKVKAIPRADRRAAVGLWTLAGSYAARQLTDGRIFVGDVTDLGCTPKDAAALVRSGLWHAHGHDCDRCPTIAVDQYVFHDWLVYQRSRDQVLAERAKATERQRQARERAASRRDSAVSNGVTSQEVQGVVTVPPTRPDPTPLVNEESGERPVTLRSVGSTKPPTCSRHPDGNSDRACAGCRAVREFEQRIDAEQARDRAAAAANCPDCHGTHFIEDETGKPIRKCTHRRAS